MIVAFKESRVEVDAHQYPRQLFITALHREDIPARLVFEPGSQPLEPNGVQKCNIKLLPRLEGCSIHEWRIDQNLLFDEGEQTTTFELLCPVRNHVPAQIPQGHDRADPWVERWVETRWRMIVVVHQESFGAFYRDLELLLRPYYPTPGNGAIPLRIPLSRYDPRLSSKGRIEAFDTDHQLSLCTMITRATAHRLDKTQPHVFVGLDRDPLYIEASCCCGFRMRTENTTRELPNRENARLTRVGGHAWFLGRLNGEPDELPPTSFARLMSEEGTL